MPKGKGKTRTFHKKKTFKVDFFVAVSDGSQKHDVVRNFLKAAKKGAGGAHTEALPLVADEDEQYMIRSLVPLGKRGAYKGVFGRCRFNETPLQGTAEGLEADVELKPGHGLVEKNHFLFFGDRNLMLYQRNPSGSHYGRFQRYLNLASSESVILEPILTTNAYERLLDGGDARIIDVSFQQPRDPALYEDAWLRDAIKLTREIGGVNARVRISVGRSHTARLTKIKNAVVMMAKGGFAKVARVRLEDDLEPIDLIADRIIESITVPLYENGRPDPEEIYAALQQAELDRAADLRSFFGS